MAPKRPKSSSPRSGQPVRNPVYDELVVMAARAVYVGSPKHKSGVYAGQVGTPGPRPTTVAQAAISPPVEPFTMLCPVKWNQLDPSKEATALLQGAILRGQIGHPVEDGLPRYVWARDPDDPSIVYQARRLTAPENGYKAYPLTETQVARMGIDIR